MSILTVSTLEGLVLLIEHNFKFLLWKDVVALKELTFDSFYFGKV